MDLDFDDREQVTDYISIPAGTYLCRITDVRERVTRNDDALWALKLVVAEGEFTGRDAAWDNLVFSSRGLNRVKTVFQALELPSDGKIQIDPSDMVGKEVFVTVRPAEYLSAEGSMIRRNEVPYDGYQAVAEPMSSGRDAGDESEIDDSIPF